MDKLTILWLDDQRDPYKYLRTKSTSNTFIRNKQFYDNLMKQYDVNFVWVKNLYQFMEYIEKNGIPQFVSFDHDLNNRGGGEGLNAEQKLNNNGVNCAKWLVNYCKQMGQPLPKFYVHSANPKHGPEINRVLTSENKQIIRLTESDLHNIIMESVVTILKEIGDTPKGQYLIGSFNAYKKSSNIDDYARKAQNAEIDTNKRRAMQWVTISFSPII